MERSSGKDGIITNRFSGKLVSSVQVVLLLVAAGSANTSAKVNEADWKRPFDGMTLGGWEVRGGECSPYRP